MDDPHLALVIAINQKEIDRLWETGQLPLQPPDPSTVHFTELPSLPPGNTFFHEWQTYRREVGKLIADGLEGKWVVIKDGTIQGVFEGWKLGYLFGLERNKQQTFLLHQILADEPIHGLNDYRRWQTSPSPLAKTA